MKDTQELIAHIIYLEGVPNMQRLNQVRIGETVLETSKSTLELEIAAVNNLRDGITHCATVGDFTTRHKLEEMIADETHVDWLETQLEAIGQIGIENYLAQQLHGDD